MLSDFFKLDRPFEEFDDARLVEHFRNSRDLRSVLFRPDEWPSELRRNKERNRPLSTAFQERF